MLVLSESSTRVFNVALSHISVTGPLRRLHDRLAASRTKDEPFLPLGTKDRLGQSFDFQASTS
jgi:hypothetical protein